MFPIQFILEVVVIDVIEEAFSFIWIMFDAKVAVKAAEVFFERHGLLVLWQCVYLGVSFCLSLSS